MVIQYKCPDCGADMIFDSATGGLHCNSCGHEERIEGYRKEYESYEPHSIMLLLKMKIHANTNAEIAVLFYSPKNTLLPQSAVSAALP